MTFGRLTVISFKGVINSFGVWNCECICGEKCLIRGSDLVKGVRTTCGCRKGMPKSFGPRPYIGGSKNPNWKGGTFKDKTGRILIYSPNHPNKCSRNYVYRYRLVMEKQIGRFLTSSEVVHHKNRIVNDDRIENLELMTAIEHNRCHSQELKYLGKWSWKYNSCVQCNKIEIPHKGHGLCDKCFEKKRNLTRNRK